MQAFVCFTAPWSWRAERWSVHSELNVVDLSMPFDYCCRLFAPVLLPVCRHIGAFNHRTWFRSNGVCRRPRFHSLYVGQVCAVMFLHYYYFLKTKTLSLFSRPLVRVDLLSFQVRRVLCRSQIIDDQITLCPFYIGPRPDISLKVCPIVFCCQRTLLPLVFIWISSIGPFFSLILWLLVLQLVPKTIFDLLLIVLKANCPRP